MSDSVINYYYAWLKYYAEKIPSDTVLLLTVVVYAIAFVCLFAYKFASYDSDVLFASKSVIRYLTSNDQKRLGSLNYYMRAFPSDIYSKWEKYYSTKKGKPSDYVSTELAYTHGVLECGFITTMKVIVTFLTAANLAFSLVKTDVPREEALFMPIIALTVGLSVTHLIKFVFTFTKRRAFAKFKDAIALLDVYAREIAPIDQSIVEKAAVSSNLKASIETVLEKEPLEVYTSDNTPC